MTCRFQKLRELIPCSDQKRDKASFLFEVACNSQHFLINLFTCLIFSYWGPVLQVIEYIRFLQDKVQKYEASCPEWNQENAWVLNSYYFFLFSDLNLHSFF